MRASSSPRVEPPNAQVARRPGQALPVTRTDMLRAELPRTMECLKSRQAHLIAEDLIEDYVTLDWMEWAGGGLRLTETGRNVWTGINKQATRA
jgi:hypothetical protein